MMGPCSQLKGAQLQSFTCAAVHALHALHEHVQNEKQQVGEDA